MKRLAAMSTVNSGTEIGEKVVKSFLCNNFDSIRSRVAKPFSPYSIQNAPNPKFVQNLSQPLFLGVPVRGSKICQNLLENHRFQILTNSSQILDPLTGPPQNNRWDKFWTNLGFGAFLNDVRGKRFRNSRGLWA